MRKSSDQGHNRVMSVDLANGTKHVVGAGNADGVLYANGRVFIQRASGPLQVWDESGSHLLRSLPGAGGDGSAMTASADGALIATLSDNGAVSVLSANTGNVLGTFSLPFPAEGGGSPDPWLATAIQFAPNGRTIFAATTGGELTRWVTGIPALVNIACATAGGSMTSAEWRGLNLVNNNPPTKLPCEATVSQR